MIISSIQLLSHVWLFAIPWIAAASLPCLSPTPRACSNSCPLSWWCHPAISSSVVPFSSCPQSLPTSGSFPMSQLLAWGGQSIGVSFSISPSNEHPRLISFRMDWLHLLVVQGTLKSLLQHHSSKTFIIFMITNKLQKLKHLKFGIADDISPNTTNTTR